MAGESDRDGPDGEGLVSRRARTVALFLAAASLAALLGGCAVTREFAALTKVQFSYNRISDAEIAGISLAAIHSYEDVRPLDVARLTLAIASKDVPLDLTVHLTARNPETNDVKARMTALDWAYLVDGSEIISGQLTESFVFLPGEPRDVPVDITLNMVSFFGRDGRALLETALVLAGQRTSTKKVTMQLTPYIDTDAGRIRYPTPITLDLSRATR